MLAKYMFKSHLENLWVPPTAVKIYLLEGDSHSFSGSYFCSCKCRYQYIFQPKWFLIEKLFHPRGFILFVTFWFAWKFVFLPVTPNGSSVWLDAWLWAPVSYSCSHAFPGRDGIECLHFWNSNSIVKGISSTRKLLETKDTQPKWTGSRHLGICIQ